ncbi:MAG: TetR/AcrR family transcriptional regulator [Microbacteriaceae bacterium]
MEERQSVIPRIHEVIPRWDATQSRILDATDELIRRRGVHGVTIAEIARRSKLSRPTVYRHWTDADDVVRSALLRRIAQILASFAEPARDRAALVEDILRFTMRFRSDSVFSVLLAEEPEAFTRYTLQRVGLSQLVLLEWLTTVIAAAQAERSVRAGEPRDIAVMLLLIAQSALLSRGTVADIISDSAWEHELRAALDGYLRP